MRLRLLLLHHLLRLRQLLLLLQQLLLHSHDHLLLHFHGWQLRLAHLDDGHLVEILGDDLGGDAHQVARDADQFLLLVADAGRAVAPRMMSERPMIW